MDPLKHFPRAVVHDVKRLNRRGFAVYDVKEEGRMQNDIKGLSALIQDEAARLRDRAASEREGLIKTMSDAHETLDVVSDLRRTVDSAVADLRAAVGMSTNNPPKA